MPVVAAVIASSYAARCAGGSRPPTRNEFVAVASAASRLVWICCTRISCAVEALARPSAEASRTKVSDAKIPKATQTVISASDQRRNRAGVDLTALPCGPRAATVAEPGAAVLVAGGAAAGGGAGVATC